jgi:two-component system sensor histidine kinase BarA
LAALKITIMAKSFRRILLSRLLLLSVPIIVLGVSTTYFVTYRKARSGLLATARQNLTESAVRRGKEITNSITALKSNLIAASHTSVLKSGDRQKYPEFLDQLSQQLPTHIECLELVDPITQESLENTCDREVLATFEPGFWPQQQENILLPLPRVKVRPLLPEKTSNSQTICQKREEQSHANQLKLLASVPIYNEEEELSAILVARSVILEPSTIEPGSLTGSTAILNQEGLILAHPCLERVGLNIEQESEQDIGRLQSVLKKAQDGEQNFIHLFAFEQKEIELLAGYTGIPNPIPEEQGQVWVVLTMAPLRDALVALDDIQRVLLILLSSLTLALILGTILVILYASREIAKPLEQLIDCINEQDPLQSQEPIPDNFKVYEFRQLARAFNAAFDQIRSAYELMDRTLKKAISTSTDLKEAKKRLQESLEAERLANERLTQTQHKLQESLEAERLANERLTQTQHKLQDSLKAETLANDRLREFLRCMSDRFRTPLTGLIMNLDLLRDEIEDGSLEIGQENEETLEDAYVSTKKLYDRHEQIAQMFSISDGKFFSDIQQVNLTHILHEISEKYRPEIQNKGLDFYSQGWENKEILIYADPERLKEILKALISNAIHYTQTGSIVLNTHIENVENPTTQLGADNHVTGKSFFPAGQKACIIIQDTGCGISTQQLEKLNNPWTNRMTSGLSIVIAHILMEMMNSTIVFDSAGENQGTTVYLRFPTAKKSRGILEEINT